MSLRAFALGCACLALSACGNAPIPVATTFEYSTQQKVRSAGHWDLLSHDVAAQTLAMLDRNGIARNTPLHVNLPSSASSFERGFYELLITHLVERGANVLHQPTYAALQLHYNTHVVVHQSPRPNYIPGQTTMLAGGLMAAYGLRSEHLDMKLLATLGLAGASDYAKSISSGGPTHTEVILSTSISRNQQYVARKTDVYYLEDADVPLFQAPSPTVSLFPVQTLGVVAP